VDPHGQVADNLLPVKLTVCRQQRQSGCFLSVVKLGEYR